MSSILIKSLSSPFRRQVISCIWKTQTAGVIKKAGKGAAPAPKKKELAVEENTEILCSRLCGGNIYKEGEDPVLKDDSEYPEWLWTLKTDWTPIPLEAYSEDDPRYWQKLKKMNIKRNIALKKHKKRQ